MCRPADRRARVAPWALLWAALGAACGPVDADHPLDPDTPATLQRPSRIGGHLIAPAGAADFDGARVELWVAEDDPEDGIVAEAAYAAPVDAGGRFRFDAVTPGVYRLDAVAGELAADPLLLTVPFGQVIDLGGLVLEPRWGVVAGRVLDRGGLPVPGATVGAGDLLTATDETGAFDLTLAAGERTLTATAPGHGSTQRGVSVIAGERVTLAAPLVVEARPASVRGTVALRRFGSPERAAAITLDLDDGADVVAPVDGAFAFEGLTAGRHHLIARATGYDPVERIIDLAPGEARALDPIALAHGSTGPDAVWLEARVESALGEPLPGVAVQVRIGTVPFARAVSDRDGHLAVPAARDDRYWLDAAPAGFVPASLGPLIYSDDARAFTGIEGDDPRLVLEPRP